MWKKNNVENHNEQLKYARAESAYAKKTAGLIDCRIQTVIIGFQMWRLAAVLGDSLMAQTPFIQQEGEIFEVHADPLNTLKRRVQS